MSSTNAVAATSATVSTSAVILIPATISVTRVPASPTNKVIVEENNSSSSDVSAKSARSRFSNNKYEPLFNPESHVYNRATPSVFMPADLVAKTKSMRVTGSSKGPGPFTTKRKEIVAAPKAADTALPPMGRCTTFKNNKTVDTYRRRTVRCREDQALEAKARAVQANISELYAQKDLLNQN